MASLFRPTATPPSRIASGACSPLLLLGLGFVLLASCAKAFDLDAASLGAYRGATEADLRLSLGRDGAVVLGCWEDPASSRFGILEGPAKADGTVALRLYGATTSTPVGLVTGRYGPREGTVTGRATFGSGEGRDLDLAKDKAATRGLAYRSLSGMSRAGLDGPSDDATRFYAAALEPSGPVAFRAWYRDLVLGGKPLDEALKVWRTGFLGDYESAALGMDQGGAPPMPWFLDSHQFLVLRTDHLLVTGIRRTIFIATEDPAPVQVLRFLVLDPTTSKALGPGDFLKAGWERAIGPLLEASFREELGLDAATPLATRGMRTEHPEPSGDFLVYSRGLAFHYGPGTIGPEAAGELFLLLPFDRLGDLLEPGRLAAYGLGGK